MKWPLQILTIMSVVFWTVGLYQGEGSFLQGSLENPHLRTKRTPPCSASSPEGGSDCETFEYDTDYNYGKPRRGRRNPERGFYVYSQSETSKEWDPITNYPLKKWVRKGYTLVYRIYVLDSFVNKDISESILDKIRQDFIDIKKAGMKFLLRFSYSINQENDQDATPTQLKKHIEQLAPILKEHAGVIAVMQAGFIGVWGEWYYTANFGDQGDISEEDYEKRRQVVFDLLEALPASRQIALRTPEYKRTILSRRSPITSEEAFTDEKVARIGHHNDCFLADPWDYGTYQDKSEEYPYLVNDTKYVTQGGETCESPNPRSSCNTALKELQELHYTYLNSQYYKKILKLWKRKGCYNKIDHSLGYRFIAEFSRIPKVLEPGTTSNVGIKLKNVGFAAPINYRSAQIVMRHTASGKTYESPINEDINLRECLPGDCYLDVSLSVPPSATAGKYEVLLKLPDGDNRLKGLPKYNILIENIKDKKEKKFRLNFLGSTTVTE